MAPANRKAPKRAASSESRYSFEEFKRDFPDDEACLVWLWHNRYSSDGTHAPCPRCQETRAFKRYDTTQQRQSWTCTACGHHIHPTAGTIFHKSSTSLRLWFHAMYLMTQNKSGTSAKQLERELGCTYKTAWRMANLIRNKLMTQDDKPLSGEVEIDDTWVGGAAREHPKMTRTQHVARKSIVLGAVERGGQVRAGVISGHHYGAIHPRVRKYVLPPSIVFTDDHHSFKGVGREFKAHHRIKHSAKIYVEGNVHTQTIEGFFGLLKNGLRGTYHSVSKKWLDSYLNEFVFRYNTRSDSTDPFWALLVRAAQ